MRRMDLLNAGAVTIEHDHHHLPGLRFEVAAGRRILLRQHDGVVFFARVHRRNYGVHVYRTDAYRPVLPALQAAHVRRQAGTAPASPAWLGRWAHQFAG
jgi:hypothetical protein